MSCPTCHHTMHSVGKHNEHGFSARIYWCPRCGTIKDPYQRIEKPKIIDDKQMYHKVRSRVQCTCNTDKLPGTLGHLPSCPAYAPKT